MLLVVGMGQAPCMGYQINVDTVFRDKDKRIYAVVRERHHGSRCGCLNEVVSPVDVIRVPRTVRPVTFLERQRDERLRGAERPSVASIGHQLEG